MRIHISTLLITLACTSQVNAQITLNATDNLPSIGDTFTYNTAAYAAAPVGGADVTFDYSGLVSTGTTTFNWIDPSEYSNSSLFTGAEMASANGTDTFFYAVTSAGLERVGERQTITMIQSFDLEIVNTNSSLNLSLPITFGQSWNDDIAGDVHVDGETGTRTGTIQGIADAYGDILLPGGVGPIPALRVTSLTQEVNIIPTGLGDVTVIHKRLQTDHYVPYLKMPILTVFTDSLLSLNDIITSGIRWMSSAPVGAPEIAATSSAFQLYPNPAADQVTLLFGALQVAGLRAEVTDATGRIVITEPLTGSFAQLNTGELLPGAYSVRLRSNEGIIGTQRLIKN